MRFIIREQEYEKLVVAGRLRYQQDGQPTGAVEQWRVTTAVDGYRILRIDLDAREAASGDSYLYHLILNPDNRLERLKFRFFGQQMLINGDLLPEHADLTLVREMKPAGQELVQVVEEFDWSTQLLLFPAAVALGWLVALAEGQEDVTAVVLQKEDDFKGQRRSLQITPAAEEEVQVAGQAVTARPYLITWAEQQRTIWLDDQHWPVKMARLGGLTAVETDYIHYQREQDKLW